MFREDTNISLFSSLKAVFHHMPEPSRGHPSISVAWLERKGSAVQTIYSIEDCSLELNKGPIVACGEFVI
jgi:hypothetical protein